MYDSLCYIFRQEIGIFYADEDFKNQLYDDVVEHYSYGDYISDMTKDNIYLKDSSIIKFIDYKTNAHGYTFSKIIFQNTIPQKRMQELSETLKHQNRMPCILSRREDE